MPRVQNPGVGAGQAAILVSTVTLNAAALGGGIGFDFIIVPAPGAGKIIVPLVCALSYAFGTHPYQTINTDQMLVNYGTDANIVMEQPPMFGVLTALSSQFSVAGPAFPNSLVQVGVSVNKPMLIHALPYTVGPLLTASVAAGGTGYAVNDTGTITDGGLEPTYRVTAVGAGGAVTAFTITNAGTECSVQGPTATATGGAQPGVGINFTVNELTVQLGDGTLKVVTYYQIIPVP